MKYIFILAAFIGTFSFAAQHRESTTERISVVGEDWFSELTETFDGYLFDTFWEPNYRDDYESRRRNERNASCKDAVNLEKCLENKSSEIISMNVGLCSSTIVLATGAKLGLNWSKELATAQLNSQSKTLGKIGLEVARRQHISYYARGNVLTAVGAAQWSAACANRIANHYASATTYCKTSTQNAAERCKL